MADTFTMFSKFADAMDGLPKRDRERLVLATVEYGFHGTEPGLPAHLMGMFTLMRDDIDHSKVARAAGGKGGRPRKPRVSEEQKPMVSEPQEPTVSDDAKPPVSEEQKPMVSDDAKPEVTDPPKPNTKQCNTEQFNAIQDKAMQGGVSPRPPKHRYGANKNVLLTDEELASLKQRFPEDWERRIDDLSFYMASKGAKYKSHYLTILTWARRDEKKAGGGDYIADYD